MTSYSRAPRRRSRRSPAGRVELAALSRVAAARARYRQNCRNGTSGITSSVKCAAVPHMRRALQDGHTPRFLNDNATSKSFQHERQCARKKAVRQDRSLRPAHAGNVCCRPLQLGPLD